MFFFHSPPWKHEILSHMDTLYLLHRMFGIPRPWVFDQPRHCKLFVRKLRGENASFSTIDSSPAYFFLFNFFCLHDLFILLTYKLPSHTLATRLTIRSSSIPRIRVNQTFSYDRDNKLCGNWRERSIKTLKPDHCCADRDQLCCSIGT